jgi:hypothetical protein
MRFKIETAHSRIVSQFPRRGHVALTAVGRPSCKNSIFYANLCTLIYVLFKIACFYILYFYAVSV